MENSPNHRYQPKVALMARMIIHGKDDHRSGDLGATNGIVGPGVSFVKLEATSNLPPNAQGLGPNNSPITRLSKCLERLEVFQKKIGRIGFFPVHLTKNASVCCSERETSILIM